MSQPLTFTLPLPSGDIAGNDRVHHMNRHKARKAAKGDMLLIARVAPVPEGGLSPVSIRIDWHGWNRVDRDNALARCKPYIDGLVDAGVIPDDSPEHVTRIYIGRMVIERADQRVVITVTPEGVTP